MRPRKELRPKRSSFLRLPDNFPDRTELMLEFKEKQANKTSKTLKTESLIRGYLSQNGLSKASEIANYIGLSPARTRAILSNMQGVVYAGATNNRKYKLDE